MAFVEDLSPFFEDFAVAATFTRAGQPVCSAQVLFDNPSQAVELYDGEVEEPAPFLTAPASEVAAVRRRDDVSVSGAGDFIVERVRPDGNGLVRMDLRVA